jgi:outer membrane protein assembly factor BamD
MRLRAIVIALALAAAPAVLGACEGEPPKTALGYTEDAKRAYDAAMQAYNGHNWIEAETLLREVKRKYSYSKYAKLAELRLADADFEQEKFPEAIREYKDFIHAHRSDAEEVAYAHSRIAEALYAQIPDSALLPASEERDQAGVIDAYRELKSYLADYPDSKTSPHIRELLAEVIARLVRHELYVARFYLKKDNYDAAIARIQYALRNYASPSDVSLAATVAGGGLQAEALLLLGQTYLKMHQWNEARQAFETLLRGYARSPLAVQARGYLDFLGGRGA